MRFCVKFDCDLNRYTVHARLSGDRIVGIHGCLNLARNHAEAQENFWQADAARPEPQVQPMEYSWVV